MDSDFCDNHILKLDVGPLFAFLNFLIIIIVFSILDINELIYYVLIAFVSLITTVM